MSRPFTHAALCAVALTAALILGPAAVSAQEGDVQAQARQLIEEGLEFLGNQQLEDGSWQPDRRVPPAITALALRAFVDSEKYTADDDLVKDGFEALLDQQLIDGGIYENLLANYNTAIAVSALAAARNEAGDDRYTEEIDLAIDYLRRLQWTDETKPEYAEDKPGEEGNVTGEDDPFFGGWGYGGRSRGAGRPDLSNAQMALEALHEAGVPKDDPAFKRAAIFISRLQNNSQTNPSAWASDDGGFVYSPGGDREYESFAGEYETSDGQRRLRSYGSMTYAGLKSMVYAGLKKDDPRVQAAFEWISNNWTLDVNPGMAEADAQQGDHGLYYYLHTLGRALDAYDQPVIDTPGGKVDWRIELVKKAAELQNDNGNWVGDAKWREDDPTLVTSYVVLALEAALKDLKEHPPTPVK